MPHVILHEDGKTISDVVEFVAPDTVGAIEINEEVADKFRRTIKLEAEYVETLRTGLGLRARGIKIK